MDTSTKLLTLKTLKNRLNNECSTNICSCPMWISTAYVPPTNCYIYPSWVCSDCVEMFKDIVDLNALKEAEEAVTGESLNPCPCVYAPEIAISRLEEYIKELEEAK